MTEDLLPLDALIRLIAVGREVPYSIFLGAGASISSGMPSAQMCIWEWKRNIFLTNNPGLEGQFSELSLNSIRERIQQWLDGQSIYPLKEAGDEYSAYVEACYPISESRRVYFQEKVRKAKPYIGYQLLGMLAAQGLISSVWTTNFDQLVSRAVASLDIIPVEVGIDTQHRVFRSPKHGELMIVSLHGDYRYDALKNTDEEVKHQESHLESALIQTFRDTPAVVCGYSGRDTSIMAAFAKAYGQRGGNGALYWCVQDIESVPQPVTNLVELARAHGHTAYVVRIQGFDDLMVRLAMFCLENNERKRATKIIESQANGLDISKNEFRIAASTGLTSILKSNAFELECPSEVLSLELTNWPPNQVWRWVKDKTKGRTVTAVPFRGKVIALGTVDEVKLCFLEADKSQIKRIPITEADLRYEDGVIVSLMRQALVQSMAEECSLCTDYLKELWFPKATRHEQMDNVSYSVHDSVQLFLRHMDERQFLILKPSVMILFPDGKPADARITKLLKLKILGWQHNREFNDAVNLWRTKLLSTEHTQKVYEYPKDSGSGFKFLIRRTPIFVEILGGRDRTNINIEPKYQPLFKQKGLEIEEPKLLFSHSRGSGIVRDVHPVRGIVKNRPFDYPLTLQGFLGDIRLGVVCPKPETHILKQYLQQHQRQIQPGRQEVDYLPTFPGFQNAFGVKLVVSEPEENGWVICPEPEGVNDRTKSIDVARNINRAIGMLQASFAPHLVLVFFPERWSGYRSYDTPSESFDVHDFVKAASVMRGMGTQFLEQSTITDNLQCRIWWWLSLAFYVKTMRTPWVLDGLDQNSAFVGLGMSQSHKAEKGKQIVMGCSHIYSSQGEGLQYRLSRVENPIYYGRNPFLSRDDSRRVGEQIRELFFESRQKLPDRVVIHKRTRFTKDELQGLREGLSGVQQVEMLEILIDDAYRYVASAVDARGKLYEDNYPVRRGTAIRLSDSSALIWVHGVTSALSGNRRYYQGKRRIPAPLMVRRHLGRSGLKEIAEEILGLSKMNWNTFDLYTSLPATIYSSNQIAKIGSLLEDFGSRSYDFRLFI